jgi:hypothetical protein
MVKPYQPYPASGYSTAWLGDAYRYYIDTHFVDADGRPVGDAPAFDYPRLAGPPESPIAWRLTRPNYMGFGGAPLPTDGDEILNIREWALPLDVFDDLESWAEDAADHDDWDIEPYPEQEDRFWGWSN